MELVKSIGLLIARVILGIIMAVHGWQMFADLSTFQDSFADMGVPLAGFSAAFAAAVELIGGILLIVGLLTPIAGIAIFAVMLGAYFFAHFGTTVAVSEGGFELVGAIGAAALALAVAGAGSISIDAAIRAARNSKELGEATASA